MSGPIFLSIDFEDFAHDLKRDLGIWDSGPLRIDALWRAYEAIDGFLNDHGARATFFCTGVIADQAPDLIARIAADGHEIACHAHFHDILDRMDSRAVAAALARAKAALQDAANQTVHGFRAPKFRILKSDPVQYRVVEGLFAYDSSLTCASRSEAADFARRMGLEHLHLLPVCQARAVAGLPPLKLGGSYLKLFPRGVAERLIAGCRAAGMIPHIYLHPYEFMADGAFLLSAPELRGLPLRHRLYWQARQHQWHSLGNAGLDRKLRALTKDAPLGGRLIDHLERLAV